MAVKALSLGSTRTYELQSDPDRGTPNATRFKIGTLDSRIIGRINDAATTMHVDPTRPDDTVETSINNSERFFQACTYGLRGWENLKDDKGNDVAFKTVSRRHGGQSYDAVDENLLKMLPFEVIAELANEILAQNVVSAEEGNA